MTSLKPACHAGPEGGAATQPPSPGWWSVKPRLQLADPPSGAAPIWERLSVQPGAPCPASTSLPLRPPGLSWQVPQPSLGAYFLDLAELGPVLGGLTPNIALSPTRAPALLGWP